MRTNPTRVYCADCALYRPKDVNCPCRAEDNVRRVATWETVEKKNLQKPMTKNAGNSCTDYQGKFWCEVMRALRGES